MSFRGDGGREPGVLLVDEGKSVDSEKVGFGLTRTDVGEESVDFAEPLSLEVHRRCSYEE
jgi:hypothetical protein